MTTQQIVLQGPGPWGFRLVGGKDFEQPLAISRVRVSWDARGNGALPWAGGALRPVGSRGGWSAEGIAVGRVQVRCALSALCGPPPLPRRRAPWQTRSVRADPRPTTVFCLGPGSVERRGTQTCFMPGRGDLGLRTPCSSLWKSWGELLGSRRKVLEGVPWKASGIRLANH